MHRPAFRALASALAAGVLSASPPLAAQEMPSTVMASAPSREAAWSPVRAAAEEDTASRLIVSIADRQLWWLVGQQTVFSAPVAVGKGTVLEHEGQIWEFSTPVGIRTVRAREANPVWIPPDWHYVEVAAEQGLALEQLRHGRAVRLRDGHRLVVRGESIGLEREDGSFTELPPGEELIIDGTLYIPPFGTAHRRIPGELGRFKLDLGDGYLIHGTPFDGTVGGAVTHGCLRMRDADLAYLFEQIPVGTRVYIY